MQQVNWGIIGCGDVTELKSGPAFSKIEGSELVAVMRRDADKAKDYATRHKVAKWYADANELIQDPDINAVYVATPPSTHAEYAIQVMEARKVVYVEKPMAACWHECIRMNEVSGRTNMPLYVAYYRRALPYFAKVRELIRSGRIGKLLFTRVDFQVPPRKEDMEADHLPWRVDPEVSGGGYFYDMACHQLDLFLWFFGRIKEIHGASFNRAGLYMPEDVVFADMEFESGMPLSGSWCFVAEAKQQKDTIQIFGTAGMIEFSTFRFSPIKIETMEGVSEFLPANPEHIQYAFIKNMVEELRGIQDKKCNGLEAALTNYAMDVILGKTNA